MLLAISKCCFLVYVYRSASAVHAKRSPTSNHYLGLFVFTVVSVVWDGLCFTSKRPGSPSSLPDPCNPGLLAQPLPRSSASNKQPLINHALLITQALLSARVCEIDLVCALLHWRPHASVLHIFQGITVSGLFPLPTFSSSLFSSSFLFPFIPHPFIIFPLVTAYPDATFGLSHIFTIIKYELLCQKLSKITIILNGL